MHIDILAWFEHIVTWSSVALVLLAFLQGGLQIWIPAEHTAFWSFFGKLTATVEYISLSRDRLTSALKGQQTAWKIQPVTEAQKTAQDALDKATGPLPRDKI